MDNSVQKKQTILKQKKPKFSIIKLTGFIILGTLLLILILIPYRNYTKTLRLITNDNQDNYQAIFLDNEQVYFGKVETTTTEFLKLNDIYYLKVNTGLQEGETQGYQGDLSLVKLGEELHGPTDEMRVNLQHVLFIEELKDDSKIVQAIKEYSN